MKNDQNIPDSEDLAQDTPVTPLESQGSQPENALQSDDPQSQKVLEQAQDAPKTQNVQSHAIENTLNTQESSQGEPKENPQEITDVRGEVLQRFQDTQERKGQVDEQPRKKPRKSTKKPAIIALVSLMLLLAVGAGIWFFCLRDSFVDTNTDKKVEMVSDEGGDDVLFAGEEEDAGLIQSDVNSELVQKLMGYFSCVGAPLYGGGCPLGTAYDFFSEDSSYTGNLDNDFMVDVAFNNVRFSEIVRDREGNYWETIDYGLTPCKLPNDADEIKKRYVLSYSVYQNNANSSLAETDDGRASYQYGCVEGAAVRNKVTEIFGRDMDIAQMPDLSQHVLIGYDVAYDEFFYWPFAGGGATGVNLVKIPYRAFSKDELFCVDTVVAWLAEREDEGVFYGGLNASALDDVPYDFSEPVGVSVISKEDAITLGDDERAQKVERYLIDHRDAFSRIRWIFRKTADGNYIFEKIEKL